MSAVKLTVQDLLEGKGKRQFTEVLTTDADEARACEAAGIDMLVTSAEFARSIRDAAPHTFLIAGIGINDPQIATAVDAIRAAYKAMSEGADAVYTGMSTAVVAEMARESVPVIGHVGYVPYRATWTGGARAVGKTAAEALQVYEATRAYEDAGAVGVEMEIVPESIAAEITRRVAILVISMGSGRGCDAQYLFACDILGTNTGHIPRHAKRYARLDLELQRLHTMREQAFRQFADEVRAGMFPSDRYSINVDEAELLKFRAGLDSEQP